MAIAKLEDLPLGSTEVPPDERPDPQSSTSFGAVKLGLGLVATIAVAGIALFLAAGKEFAPAPMVADGLTIFAVFFVVALGIERLLEPIASIDSKKSQKASAVEREKETAASQVVEVVSSGQDSGQKREAIRAALQNVADTKQSQVDWGHYRALLLWFCASTIGVLASYYMNLYLLQTAGLRPPNLFTEVLATGLIVGAGTKPLHDLVTLITAKKESAATGA